MKYILISVLVALFSLNVFSGEKEKSFLEKIEDLLSNVDIEELAIDENTARLINEIIEVHKEYKISNPLQYFREIVTKIKLNKKITAMIKHKNYYRADAQEEQKNKALSNLKKTLNLFKKLKDIKTIAASNNDEDAVTFIP